MSYRAFVVLAALSLPLVIAGCGSSRECVIDTDCTGALALRCTTDGRCVPLGPEGVDAGTPSDSGALDGAASDAARDAASDAMTDAAPMCPDPTGTYVWMGPGVGCTFMEGDTVSVAAVDGMACEYTLTSLGNPVVAGRVSLDATGSFMGEMLTVSGAAQSCDGTLSGSTASIVCGDCVITLTRMMMSM